MRKIGWYDSFHTSRFLFSARPNFSVLYLTQHHTLTTIFLLISFLRCIKKIIFNYFKGIYKKLFFMVHITILFSKKMLEKIIHKYSYSTNTIGNLDW